MKNTTPKKKHPVAKKAAEKKKKVVGGTPYHKLGNKPKNAIPTPKVGKINTKPAPKKAAAPKPEVGQTNGVPKTIPIIREAHGYTLRITNNTGETINGLDLLRPTSPRKPGLVQVMELGETDSGFEQFVYGSMANAKCLMGLKIAKFKDGIPCGFDKESIQVRHGHNIRNYVIGHYQHDYSFQRHIVDIGYPDGYPRYDIHDKSYTPEKTDNKPFFVLGGPNVNDSIEISGLEPNCTLQLVLFMCRLLDCETRESVGYNFQDPPKNGLVLQKPRNRKHLLIDKGYTEADGCSMTKKIIDDMPIGPGIRPYIPPIEMTISWDEGVFEKEVYVPQKPNAMAYHGYPEPYRIRFSMAGSVGSSLTGIRIESDNVRLGHESIGKDIEDMEKTAIDLAKAVFGVKEDSK